MVEAADLFNASPYRRTVGGIGKSLGEPHASVVPLSGVNTEVVVTVAWDISWYQYRVLLRVRPARPARRARARARGARAVVQDVERAGRPGRPRRTRDRAPVAETLLHLDR